jgi:ABC-type phosphate transport system substrate-binding protein
VQTGGNGGSANGGLGGGPGLEKTGGSAGVGGPDGAGGGAGAGGEACVDPRGFHGLGCSTCPATDIVGLENACTKSTCTRFDEAARLPALGSEGKLPALPTVSVSGGAGGTTSSGGGAGSAGKGGTGGGASGGASGSGAVACSTLAAKGSVVYVTGSSAAKPYLQQIARQIAEQSVYLVYTSTGSCLGVDAIVNQSPVRTGPAPAPATSATYWENAASSGKACDLPAAGVTADIGISDVFAQTCPGFELTNLDSLQVRDAHGPIQTMTFAVPASSPYTEISAKAAYLVFGLGKDGGVLDAEAETPIWADESYIFQRSATSGTQALLAAAIGVPSGSFRGKTHKSSDELANDLLSASATQQSAKLAIGILAADYIDTQSLRAQIRVLAYQDTEQACAVYPDSTAGARDKQNVRDGHYPLWGPLHLLYKVDGSGAPTNVANRQAILDIVGYLAGSKALPNGLRLIDVYGQSGLVPECAMRVSRSNDGGNIEPFSPVSPCSCLFDVVATGATDCKPCSVRGDCASDEACSFGYCEK